MANKRKIIEMAADMYAAHPVILSASPIDAEHIADICLQRATLFYGQARKFGGREERKAKKRYARPEKPKREVYE